MKFFRKLFNFWNNTFLVNVNQIRYLSDDGQFVIFEANEFTKLKKYKCRRGGRNARS